MPYNRCEYTEDLSVRRTLRRNIGKVCTVFTTSGGRSGEGFTGLVADVNEDSCKLITALPAMNELRPFGRGEDLGDTMNSRGRRRGCCDVLGTSCTIPLDKIACVATPEI